MRTLVIPCAGRSSRFPGMRPKWLLNYPDGKIMVEKAIEGLDLGQFDRVVVTAVKEHVDRYNVRNRLNRNFELCILDGFTSCQAETVSLTLEKADVKGSFVVKDSDNYIKISCPENADFVAGINMHTFPREVERLAAKSFLAVNSQNIITDIIEKKIVSEYVSIGMYGFRDAEVFVDAYDHLSDVKGLKDEIYLSHIISYLIGTKKSIYSYAEAKDYEDWGTVKDWYKVLEQKKTYIFNLENVLFRADGNGEIDPAADLCPIVENIEELKRLTGQEAQIILLSTLKEHELDNIRNFLESEGINVHAIIPECYYSHQTLVKGYSQNIPYPACECINAGQDTVLKDVLR